MDPSLPSESEVHELVARMLADEASPEQLQGLFDVLDRHDSARQAYIDAIYVASQLEWNRVATSFDRHDPAEDHPAAGYPAATPADGVAWRPRLAAAPPASTRGRGPMAWVAAASVVFLAGGVVGSLLTQGWGPGAFGDVARSDPPEAWPAGSWSRAVNCTWLGDEEIVSAIGNQVRTGQNVALLQGIAELELLNHSRLLVEGPAAMVVASPSSLVVQHGSIVGELAAGGGELQIGIPSGQMRIGAGEFGMRVLGDHTEVHAFRGTITISLNAFGPAIEAPAFTDLEPPKDLTLQPGEMLRLRVVDESLVVEARGKADRNQFASALPESAPLALPDAYAQRVLSSNPLAYWRMAPDSGGTAIPNEVPNGQPLSVRGRVDFRTELGNTYAGFSSGDWDDLLLTEEPIRQLNGCPAYSFELWMRPDHVHHGMVAGLIDKPHTDPHAGVVLELQPGVYTPSPRSGTLRFLHRTPPSGEMLSGTSCYSRDHYALRRWQHVVAAKGPKHMRLYINGELAAESEAEEPLPESLHVMCGQLHRTREQRAYVGQLDEVAVYDRELSPAEVLEHARTALDVTIQPAPHPHQGI